MSVKLKPCPFCGSSAAVMMGTFGVIFFVWCHEKPNGCGAHGPSAMTDGRAAVKWNRAPRPEPTP